MNRGIRLIPAIFGVVGIVIVIACIVGTKKNNDFMKNAHQTTAVITNINVIPDSSDERYHTEVHISYIVDNMEYSQITSYTTNKMETGGTLKIYYNPENPSEFKVEGEATFTTVVWLALGIPCLLIGIIPTVYDIIKKNKNNNLIETGTLVYAKIDEINTNPNISINGMNPYIIVCSYKDANGGYYIFRSKNLYFNPNNILENNNIIGVYVDMENPKNYFVDTRELEAKIKN